MAAARRRRTAQQTRERYGWGYQQARAALLASHPRCAIGGPGCTGTATQADHVPPLALHAHTPGTGCCSLRPACRTCNLREGGWAVARAAKRQRATGAQPKPTPPPSRNW